MQQRRPTTHSTIAAAVEKSPRRQQLGVRECYHPPPPPALRTVDYTSSYGYTIVLDYARETMNRPMPEQDAATPGSGSSHATGRR